MKKKSQKKCTLKNSRQAQLKSEEELLVSFQSQNETKRKFLAQKGPYFSKHCEKLILTSAIPSSKGAVKSLGCNCPLNGIQTSLEILFSCDEKLELDLIFYLFY